MVCVALGVVFGGFGAACFASVVVTLMSSAGPSATVGADVRGDHLVIDDVGVGHDHESRRVRIE
jgi:hypothetical protein